MNVCHCGTQAGYPHAGDCPRPFYGDDEASVARWTLDRERVRDLLAPRCVSCGGHHQERPYLAVVTDKHRARYASGACRFPAPPVPSGLWDADAWCRWIDGHGEWLNECGTGGCSLAPHHQGGHMAGPAGRAARS